MRNLFFLAALLCAAVNIAAAQTVAHPNAQRDIDNFKAARTAWNSGDWAAYLTFFTADAMAYGVGPQDSMKVVDLVASQKASRDKYASVKVGNGAILPVNVAEGGLKGDWILEWNQHTAVRKDGGKESFRYHISCQMVDGKCRRITYYYNEAPVMRQQGWEFTPPKSN
ncbi:MAG: hypothetical protein KA138_09985 [Saprospiraceae bacterium]|nr:hypothetical protein [Saprospiraceae bacterium]